MTKVKSRRGVSLIILALTITIIIILTSVIVVNSTDNRNSAIKTLLIENLTSVEEAVRTYYIVNGNMPLPTNEDAYKSLSAQQIAEMAIDAGIEEEINLNGDEQQSFYVVNMSLLDLDNISFGKDYNMDASKKPVDIFVVASNSFNVYYLRGQEIKGVRYYSLSSKLTNIDRSTAGNIVDSSISTVDETNGIIYDGNINILKKDISEKSLDTKISLKLEFGDVVEVSTTSKTNYPNLKLGENVYSIKDLLNSQQIEELNSNGNININIKRGDSVVESKIITVLGLTSTAASISNENEIYFYNSENTISFDVRKGDSDIEYVKYEYYNVFDFKNQNGFSSYHSQLENPTAWAKYTDENGKKVKISESGKCAITVPSNVRDILVIVKDKNGNITYAQKTLYRFYAKAEIVNQTSSKTTIKSNVVAPENTRVRISYSKDGTSSFSMPQEVVTTSNVDGASITFDNLSSYNIYIKTTLIVGDKDYSFIDKVKTLSSVEMEEVEDTNNLNLVISSDKFSPTSSPDITYTFKFSKEVTGFDINDIQVVNGEKIDFQGSGKEYKLKTFNNSNASFIQEVIVPANVCSDSSGINNDAVSVVVRVNRTVPSLYSLYVDSPYSGTFIVGQQIDFKAQFDGKVYDATGKGFNESLANAPILKIRFGNGVVRELLPSYGGEVSNNVKDLSGNSTSMTYSGTLLNYTYTTTSNDIGALSLVEFETTVYNSSLESRYISAGAFDGSKIVIGEELCRIGNKGFGGIQEAIYYIEDNTASAGAINLTSDIDNKVELIVPENKNIQINLNGHTVLSNTVAFVNNGKLDIEGNGNIESTTKSEYLIENRGQLKVNSVNLNTDGKGILNNGSSLEVKYTNITCDNYGIYSKNTKSINQVLEIDRLEVNVTGSYNPNTSMFIEDVAADISNTICNARVDIRDTSGSLRNAKISSLNRLTITSTDSNALYVHGAILDVTRGTYVSTASSAISNINGAIRMYGPEVEGTTSSVSANTADTYIEEGTFKSTTGNNISVNGGNLIINAITFNTPSSYSDVYAKSPAKVYYYKGLSFRMTGDATFYKQDVYTNEPIYV